MNTIDTRETNQTKSMDAAAAPEQEFDAPAKVLDLVVEAMAALGAEPDVRATRPAPDAFCSDRNACCSPARPTNRR